LAQFRRLYRLLGYKKKKKMNLNLSLSCFGGWKWKRSQLFVAKSIGEAFLLAA
jgi:hypothetical protein